MVRQPLAFLSGNGPRFAWVVSRLFVDTPNPWKGRLGSLASSLVILKSKKDSLLAVLLFLSGKRESDLRLPYVLLINDFPLIRRVVFPKWDTGGDIFANHFLIGFYPFGNCFSSVY